MGKSMFWLERASGKDQSGYPGRQAEASCSGWKAQAKGKGLLRRVCLEDTVQEKKGDVKMKLSDLSHGPEWVLWVVIILLAVLSAVLLSGRGSFLIAGYNTASAKEKAKYDAKRLCRVTGAGMAVMTALLVAMALLEDVLPAGFVYVFAGLAAADSLAVLIACNTFCKK